MVSPLIYVWLVRESMGFREREQTAFEGYQEYLETLVQERIQSPSFKGRIGSDVLLIAFNNANNPDKWRKDMRVTHDLGQRVLATLQKLRQRELWDCDLIRIPTP